MEDFSRNPQHHERIVLQCYLERFWIVHIVVTLMNYLATVGLICGPLVFSQPLPTPAVYPFSVDSGLPKYLAYVHQSVTGLQFSAAVTTDCQIALIMWYTGARLEMLAGELKGVTSHCGFASFIEKHRRILEYAVNISDTMSYTALFSSAMGGIGTVMSSIQMVSNQPFALKVQYGPMTLMCIANLFVGAWSAENLLRASDLVATAVCDTPWINMSTKWAKNFLFLLARSQQPVKVSIGGFIPTFSLRFYASFLSTAYSYFAALRAVMISDLKKS